MASTLGSAGARHKVIVGIDYGTTFSGVCFVTTDKTDIEEIDIVKNWPGQPLAMCKTPTRIAYARENPSITSNRWGFEATSKLTSYSWTKLLLDKNAAAGDHDDPALSKMLGSGMLQLPSFRDAAGVCEDFLHEIYVHLFDLLERQITRLTLDNTPMECWITLPAIWSDEAKDATLAAAKRAGFGNRVGDEVFTITEPEAAAIATLTKYSSPGVLNAINVNENILICDCGGGTVDITTYTITQVLPFLEFDELHIGAGAKCGSTYIDRNFHKLLSQRFGSDFDKLSNAQKGPGSKFMSEFEMRKRDFGRNDDRDVMEIGPIRLDVVDSDHYDEDERAVKLTYEDMLSLFDPVTSEITELVAEQVKAARSSKNAKINRIILVGGFAESAHLNNVLEEWCYQNDDIKLMCPSDPQAAIVRGAALRGLQGLKPRVKHVRRHYGFSMRKLFREGIDPEENATFHELDNTKLCRNRMDWLISKGEEIIEGDYRIRSYRRRYSPGEVNNYYDDLVSCSLQDAPEYSSHPRIEKVGLVHSSFPVGFNFGSDTESGFSELEKTVVHFFSYQRRIIFGAKGSNLVVENIIDGRVVTNVSIKF